MEINDIIALTGLNAKQFSEEYKIPYRTIQNWKANINQAPDYVIDLLEYKVRNELKLKETI